MYGDLQATTAPDGRTQARIGLETAALWDVTAGRPPKRLADLPASADTWPGIDLDASGMSRFDPTSRYLVAPAANVDRNGQVREYMQVWDIKDRTRPRRLGSPLPGRPAVSAMSADGNLFAIDMVDDELTDGATSVALYDFRSKVYPRRLARISSTGGSDFQSVAFAPSQPVLAVADGTDTRLYDVSDPARPVRLAKTLVGSGGLVTFSHDGTMLAAADLDGRLSVWDMADPLDPRQLGQFVAAFPSEQVSAIAFAPDDRTVWVGGSPTGADRVVKGWGLDRVRRMQVDAPAMACRDTDAGVEPEVWQRYGGGSAYPRVCP
ncbi:hypothetical protein OWR29_16745 [Actinoplanes sp. Pm04-4]|uniref:WD40 repeat domain-containing protein n=1 Tax=Paractinoplanes pyxinae TaxID=2997416 RepID=A0ABT4B1W5_9ACTN|nr:hypothetical protein [Actinoplanes pyxinae]MCY1139650.1 hypothetical protein [Actinoplanes pyxinae]